MGHLVMLEEVSVDREDHVAHSMGMDAIEKGGRGT
jgi:hypothetical protein